MSSSIDSLPSANLRQQKLEHQRQLIEQKQKQKRQQQVSRQLQEQQDQDGNRPSPQRSLSVFFNKMANYRVSIDLSSEMLKSRLIWRERVDTWICKYFFLAFAGSDFLKVAFKFKVMLCINFGVQHTHTIPYWHSVIERY